MALTFGSIASEYRNGGQGGLNAVDRAYIEECRRNSVILVDPNQLSVAYTSTNPYHASFQQKKQQLMQQDFQLKRIENKSRLRRSLILGFVLSILASLVVLFVFVIARYVRHGHYVQYFSALIVILAILCLLVLIGTRAARLFTKLRHRISRSTADPEGASTKTDQETTENSTRDGSVY